MFDVPQSLDNWPTIIGGLLAAFAAFLVPFTGFIKTVFDYRIQEKQAEQLKPDTAREVAQAPGTALFDNLALADLTAAVKDLAAAIRADTAADEAHHNSALTDAIKRFSERMDRWDEHEGMGHRPGRR